jgi:MEMO1 family protein
MPPHTDGVRKAAVAGMFYPGNARELADDLDLMFSEVPRASVPGRPIALIAPHAGYVYSGPTAAAAYGLLKGQRYQTVVVVSPSHREYFGGVSVYSGAGYETPLGLVPVAVELRERLVERTKIVKSSKSGHGLEHAVEVHLPFLQKVLGGFELLPLVMGEQSRNTCVALGEALGDILKDGSSLLVASTDLSHFHPASEAERRDQIVVNDLKRFDPELLMEDLEAEKAEACGGGPVAAVMIAAQAMGASRLIVLGHTHSGKITGDNQSVVGYCSAVMTA